MNRLVAILFVAMLPLPYAPAQHRDTCTPSRASLLAGLNQYQREYVVKQHLLQYAVEAPSENLRREYNNRDPFVRWAASVELNRRWKLEKAAEKPAPIRPKASPTLKAVTK